MLTIYIAALALAGVTLLAVPVPLWLRAFALVMLLVHACWAIPSRILLLRSNSWLGLRQESLGWSLWSRSAGWQPVQLRPDSMALPSLVVLRFKLPGHRFVRSICILPDAMSTEQHRRLRLRLKFGRRRWAAPE